MPEWTYDVPGGILSFKSYGFRRGTSRGMTGSESVPNRRAGGRQPPVRGREDRGRTLPARLEPVFRNRLSLRQHGNGAATSAGVPIPSSRMLVSRQENRRHRPVRGSRGGTRAMPLPLLSDEETAGRILDQSRSGKRRQVRANAR
jgi:hypothetical protein